LNGGLRKFANELLICCRNSAKGRKKKNKVDIEKDGPMVGENGQDLIMSIEGELPERPL